MEDSVSIFEDAEGPSAGVSSTSLSLLIRAQSRDDTAWARLVALYSPLVGHWCLRDGINPDDVDDVLQDVFIAVARSLSDFCRTTTSGSFRGWLRVICRSKIGDHFRRRNLQVPTIDINRVLGNDLVSNASASDGVEAAEMHAIFLHALTLIQPEFSEHIWTAFRETSLEGRDPVDVATELNISRNLVYLAKSRVLRRLREEFEDLLA